MLEGLFWIDAFYDTFLLNIHEANKSDMMPKANIGSISLMAISKEISFKNTPFKSSKKYFKEIKSVTGMSHDGIFSTGVAKPDIKM
mgnify:CR=1 FL=1